MYVVGEEKDHVPFDHMGRKRSRNMNRENSWIPGNDQRDIKMITLLLLSLLLFFYFEN